MTDDSSFIRKEPCPACGSRDNLARYTDGHAYCFGCEYYEPADGSDTNQPKKKSTMSADFLTGEFRAIKARSLNEETCRKFGYTIARNKRGELVHVAPYYDTDGSLCGQKLRGAEKDFSVIGNITKKSQLFGQTLWGEGGRKVIITEGEIDCLSVSQVQGNKWPVVSVPNGAQGAKDAISRHLKWLCSFEEVILFFDMDDAGRKAVADCAPLFPAGKCKIATISGAKDANELLMAKRGQEIIDAIWQAATFRPDGVVSFKDIKEAARKPIEWGLGWCIEKLTQLTYGRRFGEIYALGAGTGIGKTDFLLQQMQYDIIDLREKVGVFFLEQNPVETAKRLAGKLAGQRFHIPDAGWTEDQLTEALDALDSDKLYLYDSFGATDWEVIKPTIRFLAHSEGVRVFYLDHLTALAAAEQDEKKALETIMADIATTAKELNIIIHLVSHLATPEGKSHEEGGRVMIKHFKGSRAIGFWCHYMFGMERDQQAEDERLRTVTTFRVLKDRYTGQATGQVIYLGYDRETGRMYETSADFGDESKGADCPF